MSPDPDIGLRILGLCSALHACARGVLCGAQAPLENLDGHVWLAAQGRSKRQTSSSPSRAVQRILAPSVHPLLASINLTRSAHAGQSLGEGWRQGPGAAGGSVGPHPSHGSPAHQERALDTAVYQVVGLPELCSTNLSLKWALSITAYLICLVMIEHSRGFVLALLPLSHGTFHVCGICAGAAGLHILF